MTSIIAVADDCVQIFCDLDDISPNFSVLVLKKSTNICCLCRIIGKSHLRIGDEKLLHLSGLQEMLFNHIHPYLTWHFAYFFLLVAAWVDPGRNALQSAEQRC